jgi:thioredoxin 1
MHHYFKVFNSTVFGAPLGEPFLGLFKKEAFKRRLNKIAIMTFNEIIQSEKPVLVDFFAEWCGPCKMMAPILKDVKQELGDTTTIVKVDVDKNPQAANEFQVRGVPTLILFKEGKPLWRKSGVVQKAGLIDIIKRFTV